MQYFHSWLAHYAACAYAFVSQTIYHSETESRVLINDTLTETRYLAELLECVVPILC